jgi:hypothetical protein
MIVFETEMSVFEQSAIVNKNLLRLVYRRLMNWHGVVVVFPAKDLFTVMKMPSVYKCGNKKIKK